MPGRRVLVVDDEENARVSLSQALAEPELEVETAANGKEALAKLADAPISLLLDLRVPGLDAMAVLKPLWKRWPDMRVAMLIAYGPNGSALAAVKLDAADFVREPFAADAARDLVSNLLGAEKQSDGPSGEYGRLVEHSKRGIRARDFGTALRCLRKALPLCPDRPEAYNLLGALAETRGEVQESLRYYRAAVAFAPSYRPAQDNLARAIRYGGLKDEIVLDEPTEPEEPVGEGQQGQ
jgi:DNA-binding response OmpR family regulator